MFYFFYYFPLGLDVRPRREVGATWFVLGACVGAFLVQRLVPQLFWANYNSLVFVPAAPSLSSFVLNAYFHGGWLHIASNMITLAVFGPVLEDRLGARRFLLLYHVANVIANAVQGAIVLTAMPAHAGYGVLGASGALAGLLGLFAVRFYFARLRVGYWAFLPLQGINRWGTVHVPAAFAITVWFGTQLGIALLQREGAGAGVACGSHLGGLVSGALIAIVLQLHVQGACELRLHRGRNYLDHAHWYAAQGEFIEYVRRQPKDEQGHLELARTYRLTGRHPQADHHYREAARIVAAAKRFDRVEEIYVEAEKGNSRFALDPPMQVQLAQILERSFKPERASRAWARLAESAPHAEQAPHALYRAARLAPQDAGGELRAQHLLERLVETYPDATEAEIARDDLRQLAAA